MLATRDPLNLLLQARTYRMTDGIGSTVHIFSASGSVVTTYRYDAFGAVRSQSSPHDNHWLFAGEQRDSESGYDYLRNRYYDPEVGRFLSQDPIMSGHPYVYVRNNPVRFIDPLGLYEICGWNQEWQTRICFDSTDVRLPAEEPWHVLGNACIWPGLVVACFDGHPISAAHDEAAAGIAMQLAAYVAFLQDVQRALSKFDGCSLGCLAGSAGSFLSNFATPSCAAFALDVVGAVAIAGGGPFGVPVAALAFGLGATINASSGGIAGVGSMGTSASAAIVSPLGFAEYAATLNQMAARSGGLALGVGALSCLASALGP
jgi:RHS repeat-associated protein